MKKIKNWFKKLFAKDITQKNINDDIPDIDFGGVFKMNF